MGQGRLPCPTLIARRSKVRENHDSYPRPTLLPHRKFFPTYAALSFPFIIASRAMRFFGFALGNMGFSTASFAFEMVFRVEVTIAMCLTFYVTYRFIRQTLSVPSPPDSERDPRENVEAAAAGIGS